MNVFVLNCGSSSLKFQIIETDADLIEKDADKQLAKSEVTALYSNRVIPRDQAKGLLVALRYTDADAELILEVADLARERRFYEAAVGRVHTLFVGWRLTPEEAQVAMDQLAVPPDQKADLLALWGIERAANTRDLTEAQVVAVWKKGLVTDDDAYARLRALGYAEDDARLLLEAAVPTPKSKQQAAGA